MRGKWYQISVIFLGIVVTVLFGGFFYRELFPEYKIYQNIYIQLEKFRSTYTGEPPPPFVSEIKQILIETGEAGPAQVDRCTSCHVAMQFSHFSPTVVAKDVNGNIIYNEDGIPKKESNENYVWKKLEEKVNDLVSRGKYQEANQLKSLKTVHVGEHIYDVTKVLQAHPLIGRETRAFEYHPIDEYGCTSCHSGNGRGLVTDRAHGPVFDGQYEEQYMGPEPEFLEPDPENDPKFASVFNHKPGHRLLFQVDPLYVGALIQAKCVQCHQSSDAVFEDAAREANVVTQRRTQKSKAIKEAFVNEKEALRSLLRIRSWMMTKGYKNTIDYLRELSVDYTLPEKIIEEVNSQLDYVLRASGGEGLDQKAHVLETVQNDILGMIGSMELVQLLYKNAEQTDFEISKFIAENKNNPNALGAIFIKRTAVEKDEKSMYFVDEAEATIEQATVNQNILTAVKTEIDDLTINYQRGKSLFFSQACYACHRINGLARGGVGPELTYAGESYPWFLKESIVWPQADLKTSTMPNFHLDHDELEDLLTFLLAQHGRGKAVSETSYRKAILDWEAGAKLPWEAPINPGKLQDLRYSMTIFASEGCASCHRLKGFESNVGYKAEKENKGADFTTLYKERQWFQNLFPEESFGSEIVRAIEENTQEIDQRIVNNVRENGLLEEINAKFPELIESFYSNFSFASRARNAEYRQMANNETDPKNKEKILAELDAWKDRVNRVLMIYIQEYGLGRLIGPRPNWSGIYRSDEWLIEHFRKPSRHIAKSIMPVMPFDDSKFYALTYMLDVLAQKNRDEVRQIWNTFGFDPQLAYHIHCSQCHGEFLHGNGPVSEWIYPIPKNLRNADFLRNYTRENIIGSIIHGVKGTPMPPWGEVATDKPMADEIPVLTENEVTQLVDWLFSSLLGGTVIRSEKDVPKWQYGAEDVLEEMRKEGDTLNPGPLPEFLELQEVPPDMGYLGFPTGEGYLVSLDPMVNQHPIDNMSSSLQPVNEIFDVYPNTLSGPEKYAYYIKKRFYTEENIRAGQAFFELNCAVCHGREADGQGYRAGTMYDAKPRMLTNLHWIETRDDLRLLRSIKYGVTGTAMTPWGDQTSSLQRMQLVIFIRSLSLEQRQRDDLFNELYVVFDQADQILDTARIEEYKVINSIREKIDEVNFKRAELIEKLAKDTAPSKDIVDLYKQELDLSRQIKKHEEADSLLIDLKNLVEKEEKIYQTLGITLISESFLGDMFEKYLNLIKLNNAEYKVVDGKLNAFFDEEKEKKMKQITEELVESLERQIRLKEKEQLIVEAKLPSQERTMELEDLKADILGFKKVRNTLISGTEEAVRLREQQKTLYEEYLKKLKELKKV